MDKKALKMYEAPQVEIVDMELESTLFDGSATFPDIEDEDEE